MNNTLSLPIILVSLFILALLSFFFSASETAVIGLSKIRLRHMLAKGIKRAEGIQRLVTKLDKFIATILIGNNFVNVAISAIVTAIVVQLLGYKWGVIIATLVTSFFILVFCEITPKILATKHTEKVAIFSAPFMEALISLAQPVTRVFIGISNFILRALRIEPTKRSPLITEEELRLMIEVGKEEGVLSDQERKMLHRIFEFGDIRVKEVMIAKDKVVAVDSQASAEQVLNIFAEEGHARLPVYEGSPDNITGIIYARDLLYILRDKKLFVLQDLLHSACYVPAGMRVNEVLKKFQTEKIQIAVVVDERKKALGIVTLEDLIEEIVGEVKEERGHSSRIKN